MDFNKAHQHYKDNAALWQKFQAAHSGKGINEYLKRHPREGSTDFARRKQLPIWRPYPKLATDLWGSKLLDKKPARVLPDQLSPLVADVDRLGTPAGPFFAALIEDALAYGLAFALIDAPKLPDGVKAEELTMAEAVARNLRPYVTPLSPLDVVDWAFMPDGKLAWLVVREQISGPAVPFEEDKPQEARRVWYSDSWELWIKDKSGKLEPVDHDTHPFGEVPVVPWYAEKVGPMQGKSPLAGIVDMSLELLSIQSLLAVALGFGSLPRLAVYSGADMGVIPTATSELGGLDMDPEDKAQWLYLPSDAVKAHQIEVERLKADIKATMYRVMDQRRESAQAEAAEKTKLDLSALHAALATWAGSFEDAELKTWQLLAKGFSDCDPAKVQVAYNKRFDLRTAHERLQEALEAEALDLPSPTFRTEYRAELVKGLLVDAPPETVAKVVAELEDAEAV